MKTLVLIDLGNLYWSAWHASPNEPVSSAFEKTVTRVARLREGFDYAAVAVDSKPYARTLLYPAYKGNREPHPEQALALFEKTKERLVADGMLLWASPGAEADDVLATAAAHGVADGLAVTIASGDKDMCSVVDDARNVSVLNLTTNQRFDEAAVREKFGVSPMLLPELLALMGDRSDNIPGVPGVAEKTGANLLKLHGPTAEDVIARADEIKTEKLRNAVLSSVDAIRLARKLVQLDANVPLKWEELYEERKAQPLAPAHDWEDAEFEEDEKETPVGDAAQQEEQKSEPERPKVITPHSAPTPVTALAVVPADYSRALEPTSAREAYVMAKTLYNSRMYQRFQSADAIFAIICRGREMGYGALTSLDVFHNFEGRPLMQAHLIVARAKKDPDCEYFQYLGGDHTFAEYETKAKSNPKPTKLRYTIEQAREAGLLRPGGNWAKRPDEMLRKTCAVQLTRIEFPSAALGLHCPEEMGVDL